MKAVEYVTERCSCSAKIKIPLAAENAMEALLAWRQGHLHDMGEPPAAEAAEPPLIHESFSSHERHIPIGFAAEQVEW